MSGFTDSHSHEQSQVSDDANVVYRRRDRTIVEKRPDQEQLTPKRSLELANHSPSGFSCEYSSSGPAQLALAILLDYTDDEEVSDLLDDAVERTEANGWKTVRPRDL